MGNAKEDSNHPDMKFLWEIMVPTISNDGKPFRTRYHRVWDKKVREIANGLTIMHPVRGQWISSTGDLHSERNIPVRIACTREQIIQIMKLTKSYYFQEEVMAYKVSEEVIFLSGVL